MKQRPLLMFFIITFGITWGLAVLLLAFPEVMEALFGEISMGNPIFYLATFAPTISAIIVTIRSEGLAGIRNLIKRVFMWKINIKWYILVFIGLPLLGAIASIPDWKPQSFELSLWYVPILMFIEQLLLAGIGEEIGWRGFALPKLLEKRRPLASSLILGSIWAVWHLPAYIISGTPQASNSPVIDFAGFIIIALALTTLITWVFNNSKSSILLSGILLHTMYNFTMNVFDPSHINMGIVLSIAAITVVVLFGRKDFQKGIQAKEC